MNVPADQVGFYVTWIRRLKADRERLEIENRDLRAILLAYSGNATSGDTEPSSGAIKLF